MTHHQKKGSDLSATNIPSPNFACSWPFAVFFPGAKRPDCQTGWPAGANDPHSSHLAEQIQRQRAPRRIPINDLNKTPPENQCERRFFEMNAQVRERTFALFVKKPETLGRHLQRKAGANNTTTSFFGRTLSLILQNFHFPIAWCTPPCGPYREAQPADTLGVVKNNP